MTFHVWGVILLLLQTQGLLSQEWRVTEVNGDMNRTPFPCNIKQVTLAKGAVISELPDIPVLYRRHEYINSAVRAASTKDKLTGVEHGQEHVLLSSSNTYSHDRLEMTLRDYVLSMNDHLTSKSNETYYLFGGNTGPIWTKLENLYNLPPYLYAKEAGAVTFGIGGTNSGVSFHLHGPGFSEVVHGSKRFFLYSSTTDTKGLFDPDTTQADWLSTNYPTAKNNPNRPLYECIIYPGEILYFPDKWMHATLNVEEYNVFVSVFVDLQLVSAAAKAHK